MAQTVSERFVNNVLTIVISRVAMIVTPFILAMFGWAGAEVWKSVDARLTAIEKSDSDQASIIQEHEMKITLTSSEASKFEGVVNDKFTDINGAVKEINQTLSNVNGSIIRLQTTIENRLPARTAGDKQLQ